MKKTMKMLSAILAVVMVLPAMPVFSFAAEEPAVYATGGDDFVLPEGMNVAYKLEWDKDTYAPGETATLNVYLRVKDDMQLHTGAILFAFDTSVIKPEDQGLGEDQALVSFPFDNAVFSDLYASYWKSNLEGHEAIGMSCFAPGVGNQTAYAKMHGQNTAEEQAKYDGYFKMLYAKDLNGSHPNCQQREDVSAWPLKAGLPGAEINAVEGPLFSVCFKIAEDVEPGTELSIALPSGSANVATDAGGYVPGTLLQTYFKYFTNPGVEQKYLNVPGSTVDLSQAVATATIAEAAEPELQLTEYGAEMGAVIDTDICTTNYNGAVYGVDTINGETLEDYFTTPAGYIEVVENDNGVFSTGATVNLYNDDGDLLETYAFIYFGDVNGDEVIDISDAGDVESHDSWDVMFEEDSAFYYAADVNYDGVVDISDAGDVESHDAWDVMLPEQAEIAAGIAEAY
jgi:hypothetical protein